jgi:hypothetical protein
MNETKSQMGRPKKSRERRIGVNSYIAGGILDMTDDYVAERQKTSRGYSRSDFINEALAQRLKDLGAWQGADENSEGKSE